MLKPNPQEAFMQIIGSHKNIYKLSSYSLSQEKLEFHRKKYEKPVTFTYTLSQKLGRTAFVGLILVLVVFLGKTVSPFWGGILAMFPAAFSSVIMILHYYYGPKSLFPIMRNVALGSLSLFAYAITVMVVFPFFGFIVGTLIAYAVSVAVTLMLIRFLR